MILFNQIYKYKLKILKIKINKEIFKKKDLFLIEDIMYKLSFYDSGNNKFT